MTTSDIKHQQRIKEWLQSRRVVIVGLGGVGTHLVFPLTRFLYYLGIDLEVLLVDGDHFTASNSARQQFSEADGLGRNKADCIHEELAQTYAGDLRLCFDHEEEYLKPDNIAEVIAERDVVFLCVDNHATRKLVSDHAASLGEVALISGGNEGADDPSAGTCGNVQVYVVEDGVVRCNPMTQFHPEIASPEDKNPADLSCDEAAESGTPQILFANLAVASAMANAFFSLASAGAPPFEELYLDIASGKARPTVRVITGSKGDW